jgi:hypothetical protein
MANSFDMTNIVEEVIELTGGQSATAEDITSVQRSIWLTLQDWAGHGLNHWLVDRVLLVTNGATGSYILPPDLNDILDVRASLDVGATDPDVGSWPAIRRISRDEFNRISSRNIAGRPSRFHLVRDGAQPVIKLHPVGMANGALEVTYVRLPQPFDMVQADLSRVPARCMTALVAATAFRVAMKRRRPPDEIARLDADRVEKEAALRVDDRERVPFRVRR